MDQFAATLNEVLVDTFRSILKVEEQALKNTGKLDLSINEMHLIESVGKNTNQGKKISDIAEDLGISLPSVTIAINKLVKKGYVDKIRCENDGRVVYVKLTQRGGKVDTVHRYFHEKMVRAVSKDLAEDEKAAMLKGIIKLNAFFKQKLGSGGVHEL